MAAAPAIIEARSVQKWFPGPEGRRIEVIAPTDLAVYPEQVLALLGPSGSGKSTLLRMLAGLAAPSSGTVLWHGEPLRGQVPNAAIVFQGFALFPWLTVQENVEAPLEARGLDAGARTARALRMLDTVGLDGFETAFPKELSGGMKQRVGLARALAVEPEVLFMDEPFSAVDVLTAENLRGELMDLWLQHKLPTRAIFLVTHNIEEAVLLADRVIVLARNPGRIRADFAVPLAHPRERKEARFTEYVDYIYTIMTRPEAELPPAPGVPAAARPGAPSYPMLPHALPGGISGLLELLVDRGGHADLYQLADDLQMELDDLLPTLEAASLLGFVKLTEGDADITPEGRAFAAADILQRKELFRHAALEHVALLRLMEGTLRAKADHTMPEDFFHDLLDEHFSEAEVQRQLDTALNWGRYAELFDYDAETGLLTAAEPVSPPGKE
ncbi:MAG: nitrate/sulfonate/bicarbonate ABC transporter ATP-binding protein [Acidobacteria bacterium]|nr:MAG: nitrate/sulfonate/bicarbonate ABC transporter ATP-binding protein [Acidobacteriota bacterium]